MKQLLQKISLLKSSDIKKTIDSRVSEFETAGKSSEDNVFSELCFCLLTANFDAERAIKIQAALNGDFAALPEKKLAKRLKQLGYRFPNTRASFIAEARKHNGSLKKTLSSFSSDEMARDWLVENVKGLGYKEASHFLRNTGRKNLAIIDFHIIDLLEQNRLIEKPKTISKAKYFEIEKVLRKLGVKAGLHQSELDLYLWYMETGKILK
jgi:N-glycosylase/DNA lyase